MIVGKARVSGHQVYVQSRYRLYIVDVSNPTQPALQSTVRLDHRNKIKDFDVHKSYLYVMDSNDSLHIFNLAGESPQCVGAVDLPQFWFLGLISKSTTVKPIQRAKSWQLLLAYQSDDLLALCGDKYGKIRFSKNYLVFANDRSSNPNVTSCLGQDQTGCVGAVLLEHYDLDRKLSRVPLHGQSRKTDRCLRN